MKKDQNLITVHHQQNHKLKDQQYNKNNGIDEKHTIYILSKGIYNSENIKQNIVFRPKPVKNQTCQFIQHPNFPLCKEKLSFIKANWFKDPCYYKVHRINGSTCSIYHYLTKVEPLCMGEKEIHRQNDIGNAFMKYELDELLRIFDYEIYRWMKNRIRLLWPTWLYAAKSYSVLRLKRKKRKLRVVVFAGGLTYNAFLLETAGRGTPLGELVQWSDLTATLYILGYEVTFITKIKDLMKRFKSKGIECPTSDVNSVYADVIYTDINGVHMIGYHLGPRVASKYRCMFRVLDSFGTLPEYNFPGFETLGNKGDWSDLNLIPTQFLTFYPHTHDNLFLGFVIPNKTVMHGIKINVKTYYTNDNCNNTKPKALLYAKGASYTKGYWNYLKIVSEYFNLYATCIYDDPLPSFIHNYGPVSSSKFQKLLSQSKLFVGVGFPFEGPGSLEAMANGVVYLQPKFDKPVSRLNHHFFNGKPTSRQLSSQNPYMEEFVGEPYCFTINTTDETLLRSTLQRIVTMPRLPPKIPKEFTNEGFIERVHAFTEYINYCDPYTPAWPPLKNLHIFLGKPGQSCKVQCLARGMACERTYFNRINSKNILENLNGFSCNKVISAFNLHAPSIDVISKT